MKKVKYSFLTLFLSVIFVGFIGTANAQFYIDPVTRSYGWPPNDGAPASLKKDPYSDENALKIGGTTSAWMKVHTLDISSRGVSLYNKTSLAASYESTHNGNKFGQLELSSLDLSNETQNIEVFSGQSLKIKASIDDNGANWGNSTIFIDWDGNGSFDDHEPYQYNKYGVSSVAIVEYRNNPTSTVINYEWDVEVPSTFTEERYARIRLRVDEAVIESYWMKQTAINGYNGATLGIPECTQVQVAETNYQNFWPMCSFRFLPSARNIKGSTLDFTIKIVPDPYSTVTPQPKETIAGAGNVAAACATTAGTAISDAAGFAAFMNATSGNYYLANDITLTSLPVSQTTFSGTFDGNGHTITFASDAMADFHGTSKDACFFPYGTDDAEISENLFTKYEPERNPVVDMTNYPLRAIAGGFCGVLAKNATVKNVKLVYAANVTYKNNANEAPIFGLIAGINKGRIENVSVDIQAGKTVMLQNAQSPTASAFGGITGVLYLGIVKHCAVNIDGTMKHEGSAAMQETLTSAFIGRLQAGIVSNVKFSGNGIMYANSAAVANVRNYMGGIAGMTNTPQGEFCGNQDFDKQIKSWGYDNGTVSPDVNNVILSYTGAMNMSSAANNAAYAYHCRGLLFAEAHDTIVVPNLVTQYATTPTIKAEASADASLTSIPLISRTYGIYNALVNFRGGTSQNKDPRIMGDLYLYKDARRDATKSEKFTNVNVADSELDWAYEYDPTTCTYYSTPYAVATYTGTNANVQGIESASANVSDLGSTMVKIDPQPESVASPTWTWSETATPAATEPVETPVCEGGGTPAPMPTTYCAGQNTSYPAADGYYGIGSGYIKVNGVKQFDFTTSSAIEDFSSTLIAEVNPGDEITIGVNGHGSHFQWGAAVAYFDWNMDGTWHETQEKYTICDNDGNSNTDEYREKTVKVPYTTNCGYFAIRITSGESTVYGKVAAVTPCSALAYGKLTTLGVKVACKDFGTYCTPAAMTNNPTVTIASGFLSNLTANGTTLHTGSTAAGDDQYQMGRTITINQGDNLDLGISINSLHTSKMMWAFALAFVDLNGDGDFSDTGERIYEQGGTGSDQWTGTRNDSAPWTTTKTVTFDASATTSMLRIFTIGEYNSGFAGSTNGSMAIYNTGCNTVAPNGYNSPANRYHCYDFPIVINSLAGGAGCSYAHNFGQVFVGGDSLYIMNIGEAFTITDNGTLATSPFTAVQNGNKLEITYAPTAVGSSQAEFTITKGGNEYTVVLSGTGVASPTVTFRVGEDGGGLLSLDMGKTTTHVQQVINPYEGQLLTAVPNGPTHIEGWYVSTDGGTTFNAVGHANPDYTYTGADDAIVEVRFDFDDFEGDFGNSKFTDNTNAPYYISSITTTNGILNVNATDVFTDATIAGGSAHMRYLTGQRFQTLPAALAPMQHTITVTMKNMTTFPADARLLCLIDYNYNNYFDFTSTSDGLASGLTVGGELVFVGESNGNAEQTFTFDITNDSITQYGKTRMRFLAATYVDMYGLGPVNQYGNYQPRIDTDGDGIADLNLPLNDNNGSIYDPANQCRYVNYVNVADVNFEVVAYLRHNDEYVIRNGESIRLGDLYIESVEDATGISSGKIMFDKSAPYGSLSVEGNIIVRKRIYQDRWHDIAFPVAMQGTSGDKGVCAVAANASLTKLPDNMWLLKQFNSADRNNDGGYGRGLSNADKTEFAANTFYEFAADNVGGATLGTLDGTNYYWIQFHSVDQGFFINPSSAKVVTIPYIRDQESSEYNNRNVFTLYNPYLSPINVREITTSPGIGWENITWWNAARNSFVGVSAAETRDMPPYFGYWVQFTEDIETTSNGDAINVVLGDVNRQDYAYPDDGIVNFAIKSASAAKVHSFDTPDAYTLGIDRATTATNKNAISSTIVTLTDAGSIDEFRAGYDMPVSYAAAKSTVPEIWSKAGSSRMMFNDVMRDDEVVVPVGIRIKEAGEYVVRLTHTNYSASLVQLYDKVTGSKVDLQRNEELFSYSFLAEAGDDERFELIIVAPNAMTDLDIIESDEELAKSAIYNVGSMLRLVNLPLGYSVAVCDVVGRELLQTTIVDANMQLQLPSNQGVYLVNVRNASGNSVQVVKLTR